MSTFTDQATCRICNYPITPVFSLGSLYPSAFVGETDFSTRAPLTLAQCSNCGLVQLAHSVDLDEMYRNYFYQSGINASMVVALKSIVDEARKLVIMNDGDVVVDIASNDGTLLGFYPRNVITVGFDPAQNLKKVSKIGYFFNDYFNAADYDANMLSRARIVTSIAMFYDLPDPRDFVQQVRRILADDGVWIIQFTDLKSMLVTNAFDNLCHEHLEYYSVHDITRLMSDCGLQVFRIEHNDVNGGSLRFYIGHAGEFTRESSVERYALEDIQYLNSAEGSLAAFADRVSRAKELTLAYLGEAKRQGKVVYGLAASTKGNTLLQYFGIDSSLVSAIADLNPDKFGKVTVGSGIPIISEVQALADPPDCFMVLAWHFIPHFIKSMREYMQQGGVLFCPLPRPIVYRLDSFGFLQSEFLELEVESGD